VLQQVADLAEGALVPAELPDQAGAIRELLSAFQRAPISSSSTQDLRPLVWIPALIAAALLGAQTIARRTAALIGLAMVLLGSGAFAQRPAPGTREFAAGDVTVAARRLTARLGAGASDTAWYNAGTALLAAQSYEAANRALARASRSLDPDLRYRALYNQGVAALRLASVDSTRRDSLLGQAADYLKQALALAPASERAKWNLELAQRRRTPPPAGGGPTPQPPPPAAQRPQDPVTRPPEGMPNLSETQAEQILNSVSREELETRSRRHGRARSTVTRGKDW
jgi:tetratricopeptide (TPR) repeat protein